MKIDTLELIFSKHTILWIELNFYASPQAKKKLLKRNILFHYASSYPISFILLNSKSKDNAQSFLESSSFILGNFFPKKEKPSNETL